MKIIGWISLGFFLGINIRVIACIWVALFRKPLPEGK